MYFKMAKEPTIGICEVKFDVIDFSCVSVELIGFTVGYLGLVNYISTSQLKLPFISVNICFVNQIKVS
jgi:hypothetical protein